MKWRFLFLNMLIRLVVMYIIYKIKDKFDVYIWRSTDGGAAWNLALHEPRVRAESPVTINRSADGTIFIAGNLLAGKLGSAKGCGYTREILCLWPLNERRDKLERPVFARCAGFEWGPPPADAWSVDHPMSAALWLAGDDNFLAIVHLRIGLRRDLRPQRAGRGPQHQRKQDERSGSAHAFTPDNISCLSSSGQLSQNIGNGQRELSQDVIGAEVRKLRPCRAWKFCPKSADEQREGALSGQEKQTVGRSRGAG